MRDHRVEDFSENEISVFHNSVQVLGLEHSLSRITVKPGMFCALALALFFPQPSPRTAMPAASPFPLSMAGSDWVLTWSDEFDGPDESPPNPAKWNPMGGGNGWGNNELQYYTTRHKNIRQENGHLVIEAFREDFVGPDGIHRHYTSGRLTTQARFSQEYGRFEARIQVPSGQGVWPAFWMLGENFPTAGWPACGEIDIMETIGKEPASVRGSLHGPGYSGATPLTTAYILPQGRFSDGFHIFAVEWEPQSIRFYVDGGLFSTKTPGDLPAGGSWVFDHPFFILLNLAVGGDWPGSPDASTVFPQRMLVDYVRVYSRKKDGKRLASS